MSSDMTVFWIIALKKRRLLSRIFNLAKRYEKKLYSCYIMLKMNHTMDTLSVEL